MATRTDEEAQTMTGVKPVPTLLNTEFWANFTQNFQADTDSLEALTTVGQEIQRVRALSATSLQGKIVMALEACQVLLKNKDKALRLPSASKTLASCRKLLQDKSDGSAPELKQLTAEWKAEHALHCKHITAATTAIEADNKADFKVLRWHCVLLELDLTLVLSLVGLL